jgi:hypothetical protein
VQAVMKRSEVESARSTDDELAVEHDASGELLLQRGNDVGEVRGEPALLAGLEHDPPAGLAEGQAPPPVELRLVCPPVAARQLRDGPGRHRQ